MFSLWFWLLLLVVFVVLVVPRGSFTRIVKNVVSSCLFQPQGQLAIEYPQIERLKRTYKYWSQRDPVRPNEPGICLVWLHGNGNTIDAVRSRHADLRLWLGAASKSLPQLPPIHVLAPEYYGTGDQMPRSLQEVSRACADIVQMTMALHHADKYVLVGCSLGGAVVRNMLQVAPHLEARCCGAIFISSFAALADVVAGYLPCFPRQAAEWVARTVDPLDGLPWSESIDEQPTAWALIGMAAERKCPVLILHGTDDPLIPCDSELEMAARWRHVLPLRFQTSVQAVHIPDAEHNLSLGEWQFAAKHMAQFLQQLPAW